jgi:hypothetical protein
VAAKRKEGPTAMGEAGVAARPVGVRRDLPVCRGGKGGLGTGGLAPGEQRGIRDRSIGRRCQRYEEQGAQPGGRQLPLLGLPSGEEKPRIRSGTSTTSLERWIGTGVLVSVVCTKERRRRSGAWMRCKEREHPTWVMEPPMQSMAIGMGYRLGMIFLMHNVRRGVYGV